MRRALAAMALSVAATVAAAEEPTLAPALTAQVSVSALDGTLLDVPEAGIPVRLDVMLESAVGTDAPRGLDLFAWLRPGGEDGTSCSQAARAYFAAERNLPTSAIPLSGSVLAVLTGSSAISLADPNFQLASANIVDAETLPDPITRIVADPFLRRVLALSSKAGSIWAFHASGGAAERIADGLTGLRAAYPVPSGPVVVHTDAGMGPLGGPAAPADGSAASASGRHVAGWTATNALVIDVTTGARLNIPMAGIRAARPVETIDGALAGLAALTADGLSIAWTDAPGTTTQIALPPGFERLDIDATGRFAVLHAPGVNDIAILDVALGEVAQIVLSKPAISEAAFTSRDLYLLASDRSRVAAMELAAIRKGAPPQIRESVLGTPEKGPLDDRGGLVPLPFEDAMIAVHPSTYTAFRLHGSAPTGRAPPMLSGASRGELPPMFAVTLRGGVPRQTVAIDRGFREVAPGRFRTVVTLPDERGYELVGTTGLGGMSFCSTLTPGNPALAARNGHMALLAEGDGWRIRFTDAKDRPVRFAGRLLLVGLDTGWRGTIRVSTDDRGLTREVLRLPVAGDLAIVADDGGGQSFTPITRIADP